MNPKRRIVQEIELLSVLTTLAVSIIPPMIFSFLLFKNSKDVPKLSKKINKILESGGKWQVRVLPTDMVNAFSSGDVRIYLTKSLLKLLTTDEVIAVMLHEAAHTRFLHIPGFIAQHKGMLALGEFFKKLVRKYALTRLFKSGGKLAAKIALNPPWWFNSLMFLMTWIMLITTRRWLSYKVEKQADMFVIKKGYGEHLATALHKLNKHLADWKPPLIMKPMLLFMRLMNNHPEIQERIMYSLNDPEIEKAIKAGNKKKATKIMLVRLREKVKDD